MSDHRILATLSAADGISIKKLEEAIKTAACLHMLEMGVTYEVVEQMAGATDRIMSKYLSQPNGPRRPGYRPSARGIMTDQAMTTIIGGTALKILIAVDPEQKERGCAKIVIS